MYSTCGQKYMYKCACWMLCWFSQWVCHYSLVSVLFYNEEMGVTCNGSNAIKNPSNLTLNEGRRKRQSLEEDAPHAINQNIRTVRQTTPQRTLVSLLNCSTFTLSYHPTNTHMCTHDWRIWMLFNSISYSNQCKVWLHNQCTNFGWPLVLLEVVILIFC